MEVRETEAIRLLKIANSYLKLSREDGVPKAVHSVYLMETLAQQLRNEAEELIRQADEMESRDAHIREIREFLRDK